MHCAQWLNVIHSIDWKHSGNISLSNLLGVSETWSNNEETKLNGGRKGILACSDGEEEKNAA